MSRYGYTYGGNDAGSWGSTRLRFQRDAAYDREKDFRATSRKPDMFSSMLACDGGACKTTVLDADGRVVTGMPFSCPPNVKCNVQDYSSDGNLFKNMQYPGEMRKAYGMDGGTIQGYTTGGSKAGFPQGMFQRKNSFGWSKTTSGVDNDRENRSEGPVANGGWSQSSQFGRGSGPNYPTQNGWGTSQGYPGYVSSPTTYLSGDAKYKVPGAVDSRGTARRYDNRFIIYK